MNSHAYTDLDMIAIEQQARELRAEAIRFGSKRISTWFKNLFYGNTAGADQVV